MEIEQQLINTANKIFEDLLNNQITIMYYNIQGKETIIDKRKSHTKRYDEESRTPEYTISCLYITNKIQPSTDSEDDPNIGVEVWNGNNLIYKRAARVLNI